MSSWATRVRKVAGIPVEFAELSGAGIPLVYLHGLGSDWRDFSAASEHPLLSRHRIIVPSLPGHGRTPWPNESGESLAQVASVVDQLLRSRAVNEYLVIGHSLGGAIAVHLAQKPDSKVRAIVSVEGNLVKEDCGLLTGRTLTRTAGQITHAFFDDLTRELTEVGLPGYAEYARSYRSRVNSGGAWYAYAAGLMAACSQDQLLQTFLQLPCARAYIYGELAEPRPAEILRNAGIRTRAVPNSAHWPMYSNPDGFLDALAAEISATRQACVQGYFSAGGRL